ncbi:aldehyde dehydrogenase family protein [Mesorhizobium sp. WSM3864]|uniref:aldehyde dehydrogenase family protein n=1 Tax=Mesorhizobium sp. WSM3864 TaxID=2029404 RepID=UPI001FE19B82|nr:aldehyde dehydrogenase family protein [Mesorhizobium sp. WSM3864]
MTPISSFEDAAEATAKANSTEYGIAAYIYARNLAKGTSMASKIESGMIALNRGLISDPAAPSAASSTAGLGATAARSMAKATSGTVERIFRYSPCATTRQSGLGR